MYANSNVFKIILLMRHIDIDAQHKVGGHVVDVDEYSPFISTRIKENHATRTSVAAN